MTATLDPVALIGESGLALLLGGIWLFVADRRDRMSSQRIIAVVQGYASAAASVRNIRRKAPQRGAAAGAVSSVLTGLSARLAFLGIKADRPELYPVPWWMILSVTTILVIVIENTARFFIGPIVWGVLPIFWLVVVRAVFNFFLGRYRSVLYGQFPDTLAMIVRSIRTGLTVQDAMRVVAEEGLAPTSAEFQRLTDEIRLGMPMAEALARMVQRIGLMEYKFFTVALILQGQAGGSLSEMLENLADVVRKRVALKQRATALAAEAKMSMYVLGAMPFATAGALMVINPGYLGVLITTDTGKNILSFGVVLFVLGFGAMRLIISRSLA